MGSTTEPLTTRQVKALQRLKELPVPPVPALKPSRLEPPPWWYRRAPQAAVAGGLLFLCILSIWPLLTEPATWNGAIPLGTGSTIELADQSQVAVSLSGSEGTLVIQGPARFEVARLERHRITGQLQAQLLLHEGELLLQCSSHAPKAIQIQTPLVKVRVTGTKLLVGHREPQGSRVGVVEGKVLAKPQGVWKAWDSVSTGQILKVTPEGAVQRLPMGWETKGSTSDIGPTVQKEQLERVEKETPGEGQEIWRILWREE